MLYNLEAMRKRIKMIDLQLNSLIPERDKLQEFLKNLEKEKKALKIILEREDD